ncbi:DUF1120 domain-containing protein [Pseudomonas sp. GD03860]|uniref:DUF1120 domain-containing protein n=1 Tax=Pseudomonas TaxID=286 RepID=UPI0023638E0A|nr:MULTISPECIES: DUF1120 domain-containing protein [Pseudomonas]MDD2060845.1 DUF1120 domain-containing protein [Pseudomonas putida]MDH0638327.1 DUF1120 domain-containing protein [Pseudomonas sp. GD03860]
MKKSALSLSLVAALAGTHAFASTTELSVIGTITPTACTPSLSNNGVVDYGPIHAETLDNFQLPDRTLTLSISCGAEAPIAVIATDNLSGSASTIGDIHFGMGTYQTMPIGRYSMAFQTAQVDGQQLGALESLDGGATWRPSDVVLLRDSTTAQDFRLAFGTTNPQPTTTLSAVMRIQGSINEDLPFTDDIELNGNSTLEIKYL